ncbi:MAG: NADP-dependent succinic semialdehyde dehydrogenase [Actinobacteria bacterium]|nr:NADP-dependent succinic semialdehyde dehydrogenase [Actinomycetota bacterium]
MAYATINPATGETLETFDDHDDGELDRRLTAAVDAHHDLRGTSFDDRAGWMRAAADLVDDEADDTARMMTTEMGKTLAAAEAEVHKCATAMRFYADHAEEFLADVSYDTEAVNARRALTIYQPLGPVLAIMPWNFPLWQAVRFAAPALMAGNTGVLKHASNVPQSAQYLGQLFGRAGFPGGAFQHVFIGSDRVESVLADDRIRAATLTGSEGAGRAVAAAAGKYLKKVVLELGGSDPFVVMPSADLDEAAKVATTARCQNNGQSCIAAKRFIVHADCYDEFADLFAQHMAAQTLGDPMDDDTDIGPLANEQGRSGVIDAVDEAVDHGANVLVGGDVPDREGWWYPATVITEVPEGTTAYEDEVFGPVASLFKVGSYDEAIAVANDVPFGLGSNAWTDDGAEQHAFARDLHAGMVFINGMTASYPQLPFGGVGTSGYGRELADVGIKEFCNAKTVWVGGPQPTS